MKRETLIGLHAGVGVLTAVISFVLLPFVGPVAFLLGLAALVAFQMVIK